MNLHDELRQLLEARASTVRAEPDLSDLEQRVERADRRSAKRERGLVAAAVVVLAGVVGGASAAFIGSGQPQRVLLSAAGGNQGGTLPKGPPAHEQQSWFDNSQLSRSLRSATDHLLAISRTGAQGVALSAVVTPLQPVAVSIGAGTPFCSVGELVSTTATVTAHKQAGGGTGGSEGSGGTGRSGGTGMAGGAGVAGLQPLSADGLEVVSSGSARRSSGANLWWAAVAVGPGVARVAAEEPGGAKDSMRPVDGIAVLGGLMPSQGYLSVVAEDGGGQSLYSFGFKAGSGPDAAGAGAASAAPAFAASTASAGRSCATPASATWPAGGSFAPPVSPRLAASAVVAAFHQAYSVTSPGDAASRLSQSLSVVDLAGIFVPTAEREAAAAASTKLSTRANLMPAVAIDVSQVTFLSASKAEVVYKLGPRFWRTGTAVLGRSGRWLVSTGTFCGDLVSGALPAADTPRGLLKLCAVALRRS